MRTYLLPWNPDFSQYKMADFETDFRCLEYGEFNWTLSADTSVHSGDNFYVVKHGGDSDGIVMKGFFITEPSREGRHSTTELRPSIMLDPANGISLVTVEQLSEVITDINLKKGLKEILLNEDEVAAVDKLWKECLQNFSEEDFHSTFLQKDCRPSAEVDDAVCMASEVLYDMKDETGEALVVRSLRKGLAFRNRDDMICSLLQDILSIDESIGIGMIREKGFSEEIADRLQTLIERESAS